VFFSIAEEGKPTKTSGIGNLLHGHAIPTEGSWLVLGGLVKNTL